MATIIPTPLVMARGLLTLNDVFPNALTGSGIFNNMTDLVFNPDSTTAGYLDFDYFGNRSGDKVASKLIHKLADKTGVLDNASILKLAGVIKTRYTKKWEQFWNAYAIQPWFDNIAIYETESETGNTTENKSTKANESETLNRTDNSTDTTKGTDSVTNVRTGAVETSDKVNTSESETESGSSTTEISHTGSVVDAENSNGLDSSFGFNSTNSANPVSQSQADASNTRTFSNKDTTTETPNKVRATVSERGNTSSQEYKNLSDVAAGTNQTDVTRSGKSNQIRARDNNIIGSKTGNSIISRNRSMTGYDFRRQDKIQNLIELFENPNLFPFFEIVFEDVDNILCIPVFK